MTTRDKTAEEQPIDQLVSLLNRHLKDCPLELGIRMALLKELYEWHATAIRQAHDDAIEKSAQAADRLCNGFHSPHEYADDVAEAIRALKHQTKGGA